MALQKTGSIMIIMMFTILLSSPLYLVQQAQASKTVTLKELGVLQLAAHDLFDVDRNIEKDFENGKLDLSTLLINMRGDHAPYPDSQIMTGGEHRNAENAMIFSVASELGERYVELKDSIGPQAAKQQVLAEYHNLLALAYLSAFGESPPAPGYGCPTMTENLALRSIHDFLPEFVDFDGGSTFIFDIPFFTKLSSEELEQPSSPLDGAFDEAFATDTLIPALGITVNLLEKDQSFGTQFGTLFSFDFFLSELADEGYDHDEEVMKQVRNLFAKGYGHGCYVGGATLPIEATTLILAGIQTNLAWLLPLSLALAALVVLQQKKGNQ